MLLLDEPLGALDLKLRRQMQIELKRIQTEVGITFVHVTHDQEEAMTMADTVAVMNHGRIEQLGAPAELYETPGTTFVANFLGQSNLVAARRPAPAAATSRSSALRPRYSVPPAAPGPTGAGPPGGTPEKMHLVDSARPGAAGHQHVTGVVTDASYMGVSTQYLLRTGWGGRRAVRLRGQRGRRPGRWRWAARPCVLGPAHAFLLAP